MPLRDRTGPEGLGPFTGRKGMGFGASDLINPQNKTLLIATGIGAIVGIVIGLIINKKN